MAAARPAAGAPEQPGCPACRWRAPAPAAGAGRAPGDGDPRGRRRSAAGSPPHPAAPAAPPPAARGRIPPLPKTTHTPPPPPSPARDAAPCAPAALCSAAPEAGAAAPRGAGRGRRLTPGDAGGGTRRTGRQQRRGARRRPDPVPRPRAERRGGAGFTTDGQTRGSSLPAAGNPPPGRPPPYLSAGAEPRGLCPPRRSRRRSFCLYFAPHTDCGASPAPSVPPSRRGRRRRRPGARPDPAPRLLRAGPAERPRLGAGAGGCGHGPASSQAAGLADAAGLVACPGEGRGCSPVPAGSLPGQAKGGGSRRGRPILLRLPEQGLPRFSLRLPTDLLQVTCPVNRAAAEIKAERNLTPLGFFPTQVFNGKRNHLGEPERLQQHGCNSCSCLGKLGQASAPAQPSRKSTEEQAHHLQSSAELGASDAFIATIALCEHNSLACCITSLTFVMLVALSFSPRGSCKLGEKGFTSGEPAGVFFPLAIFVWFDLCFFLLIFCLKNT